ncbi:MAG: glycine cleavage system aminomethyltransferase GcvT [Gammaproteobacteria bacterium]|nr:MAG: glycine cleavage system aminomethyltransferase GcvT [Gammaproteobacteria bacterium]
MTNRTPLYDTHLECGAKMVDFAGWDMPIHYGSQIDEHHKVRTDAGMFDVSHMVITDLQGGDAKDYLRYLLANDVEKLKIKGKALYSCMLNENGGVIDDLIVYYIDDGQYRIVSNGATREKDLAHMREVAEPFDDVTLRERDDLAMIAVQGPNAADKLIAGMGGDSSLDPVRELKPFHSHSVGEMMFARTGYTGEDGFEIMFQGKAAPFMWKMLQEAGVVPVGLGARDTLRLEAGMNLYGADMDEEKTPFDAGLAWTVAMKDDRDFIGRAALEKQQADGLPYRFVGLVLEDKGVLRNHQAVLCGDYGEGEITSGSFSPTLGKAIAMARIPAAVPADAELAVDMRGKPKKVRQTKMPFVRDGKPLIAIQD